jgi:hypothetical protein
MFAQRHTHILEAAVLAAAVIIIAVIGLALLSGPHAQSPMPASIGATNSPIAIQKGVSKAVVQSREPFRYVITVTGANGNLVRVTDTLAAGVIVNTTNLPSGASVIPSSPQKLVWQGYIPTGITRFQFEVSGASLPNAPVVVTNQAAMLQAGSVTQSNMVTTTIMPRHLYLMVIYKWMDY